MNSPNEKSSSKGAQYLTIFMCWLVYTIIYFGKYSYNANISLIEQDYGVTHAQAGLVLTFFALVYGIGQMINGILCSMYPRRFTVPIALTVSALINLAVFLGVPFPYIKYLWIIDAAFLSVLWPEVMQVISENVGTELMPKAVLVMSTTTSAGTLLIYGVSALNTQLGNYKLTFIVSTVILLAVALLWPFLYRQGNFLVESEKSSGSSDLDLSRLKGWLIYVPFALFIILIIIAAFTKDGLQSWAPVILKQLHGMPDSLSIMLTLILPLFGILGAGGAVFLFKKLKSYIALSLFFFFFISLFNLVITLFYNNVVVLIVSFGILEFLLHGLVNVIVSIFPLAVRGRFSAGAVTGILNGVSYAGSAASSFLLGKIADDSGWPAVFITLFISALIALALVIVYKLSALKKKELDF
ncbi:MAG: MFS transporter [Firmicutes bacterium]|nr:MFS transporter [Candidatus Colimorpha enterica]